MWTLHTKNPEHWVALETVASFKRMREYTQALGLPALAALLRTSEELEVDEEGKNVRRKKEVEEPKGQWERSVYAVRSYLFVPDVLPSLFFWLFVLRWVGRVWLRFSFCAAC